MTATTNEKTDEVGPQFNGDDAFVHHTEAVGEPRVTYGGSGTLLFVKAKASGMEVDLGNLRKPLCCAVCRVCDLGGIGNDATRTFKFLVNMLIIQQVFGYE
ncbi:MAG: hypothetical protein Q9187_005081 [Circinaria calcarea]